MKLTALVPARLYSNIPIASAIQNYKENKRIWKLALLFSQICFCTFLMSLVVVIGLQYRKAINDKPGYEYENLIFANLRGTDSSVHQSVIDRLLAIPGVDDVQMSYGVPLEWSSGYNVFLWETPIRELFNIADQYEGTEGLFSMLGIQFVEGHYPQTLTEVAVRKINGATVRDILGLFVREIGLLGIVAALLADAGAFFTANVWLENFAEKISLSPLIFLSADIIILAIVATTVILCCLRISRANPVDSLKDN